MENCLRISEFSHVQPESRRIALAANTFSKPFIISMHGNALNLLSWLTLSSIAHCIVIWCCQSIIMCNYDWSLFIVIVVVVVVDIQISIKHACESVGIQTPDRLRIGGVFRQSHITHTCIIENSLLCIKSSIIQSV